MTQATEGKIDFVVGGETFQTYYKLFGDISTSNRRPLVAIHGGPGIGHFYMVPFGELATTHGIPVIVYDQLGAGYATHLPEKPAEFWTMDLFMDELENLLKYFGIFNDFGILGHSWGGMIASWYASTRQPAGLKKLIIADSMGRMHDWVASNLELLKDFPQDVQDAINKHELDGTTDTEEYKKALAQFQAKHVCRVEPPPEDLVKALESMASDPSLATLTWGPGWLRNTGILKDWDVVDRLKHIKVPTMIYNGRYDQAQDPVVLPLFQEIPKVRWVKFENSSHMPHFEEKETCLRIVEEYLSWP